MSLSCIAAQDLKVRLIRNDRAAGSIHKECTCSGSKGLDLEHLFCITENVFMNRVILLHSHKTCR